MKVSGSSSNLSVCEVCDTNLHFCRLRWGDSIACLTLVGHPELKHIREI
jgi:hypothetical protein